MAAEDELLEADEVTAAVALADQELQSEEVELLREFAAALGYPTEGIPGWEMIRTWG